jgi:rubrerythrin
MKYGKDTSSFEDVEAGQDMETGAGTMNRTGITLSPETALDMIREAQKTPPDPKGDAGLLAQYRRPYIEENSIMGSMPLPNDMDPGEVDGSARPLLLDKLGERLAFERQGVRLYECLIGKVKIQGTLPGGPTVEDLEHILEEERGHFRFLQEAITQSGGDPTVKTPCANVAGVLSQGIVQIVADPRTNLVQCLEAMLNAELVDNDGWAMLSDLANVHGAEQLLEKIEEAESNEQEHLENVRGWLSALVIGDTEEGMDGEEVGSIAEAEDPMGAEKKPLERPRRGKPDAGKGRSAPQVAPAKKKRKS